MLRNSAFVIISALALAGCDAATQIAGEAVDGEIRNVVASQCQQVAESAGIVAGRIAEVCECSADRFIADGNLSLADINPQRVEEVVNSCAAQTGAATGNPDTTTQTLPTEEIGG